MKKIFIMAVLLLAGASAFAQDSILDRFTDPEKGRTTFIPKGCRTIGISGSYRGLNVGGENAGDGYAIFSMLNIGDGALRKWNVAPTFNIFVADDLSLGLRLDYNGYSVDTDLKLDLRNILGGLASDPTDLDDLNLQLSARHMTHHSWGASFVTRKYLSFFGSKTFGVFGEGRLFGNYGISTSYPYDGDGLPQPEKLRTSRGFQAGIKLAAGAAVRLRDGSTISLSIPIVGLGYNYTWQHKEQGTNPANEAHMSSFNISRDIDFIAIQVGYSRFIEPKKRH